MLVSSTIRKTLVRTSSTPLIAPSGMGRFTLSKRLVSHNCARAGGRNETQRSKARILNKEKPISALVIGRPKLPRLIPPAQSCHLGLRIRDTPDRHVDNPKESGLLFCLHASTLNRPTNKFTDNRSFIRPPSQIETKPLITPARHAKLRITDPTEQISINQFSAGIHALSLSHPCRRLTSVNVKGAVHLSSPRTGI
jgi:hypothetical protein